MPNKETRVHETNTTQRISNLGGYIQHTKMYYFRARPSVSRIDGQQHCRLKEWRKEWKTISPNCRITNWQRRREKLPSNHEYHGKTSWRPQWTTPGRFRHFAICWSEGRSCLTERTTCNCRHNREVVNSREKQRRSWLSRPGVCENVWQWCHTCTCELQVGEMHSRKHDCTYIVDSNWRHLTQGVFGRMFLYRRRLNMHPKWENIRQKAGQSQRDGPCAPSWYIVFRNTWTLDRVRDGNHLHGAAERYRERSPEEVQLQIHIGSRVFSHSWVRHHTCVDGSRTSANRRVTAVPRWEQIFVAKASTSKKSRCHRFCNGATLIKETPSVMQNLLGSRVHQEQSDKWVRSWPGQLQQQRMRKMPLTCSRKSISSRGFHTLCLK